MGTSRLANAFGGLIGSGLDPRAPVGIADGAVFRELFRPWLVDALKERAIGPPNANQEVGAEKALIEKPALIFAEVVVMTIFQQVVAGKESPGGQWYLLRIEVRSWILVRKMDAVVAGGIIPAAVYIDGSAWLLRKKQMAVGPVHISADALTFEVVDDIRQCFPLQQIVANLEGTGADSSVRGGYAQKVIARCLPGREVSLPEVPVPPVIDCTLPLQNSSEDRSAGFIVDQSKP